MLNGVASFVKNLMEITDEQNATKIHAHQLYKRKTSPIIVKEVND